MRLVDRFGAAPPRSFDGVFVGRNPDNPNTAGFLDLELCDPATLLGADNAALAAAVSDTPKLIRTIATNKVPNLFPIVSPDPAHVAAARILSLRRDFMERVGHALSQCFTHREEPQYVEQKIFAGFYSNADKRLLEEFRAADWTARAELVGKFNDDRLEQLGQRVVFLNAPEMVPETYRAAAHAAIDDKWRANDPKAPWTTAAAVEMQLVEIAEQGVLGRDAIERWSKFYEERLATIGT